MYSASNKRTLTHGATLEPYVIKCRLRFLGLSHILRFCTLLYMRRHHIPSHKYEGDNTPFFPINAQLTMLTMRVAAYELFHEAYLQEAAVLWTKKSKYKRMLQKKLSSTTIGKKSCPVQQQTAHPVSWLQCHERQIILILAGLQAKRTWPLQ